LKQLRKRLTYANVMSSIAVFLVLGGASAFAATQLAKNSVGSKQLKKNAVTSPKIKNGAVTASKLAPSARDGLRGAPGPAGAVGPAGPRGPSNGRYSTGPDNVQIGKSEEESVVVTELGLPPGKWMITATTGLTNISGGTRSAWCALTVNGARLGLTRALDFTPATQISGSATVLGAANLSAESTVQFRCWSDNEGVWVPDDSFPAMQAIQVETLTAG
jgi:hypothetical protein